MATKSATPASMIRIEKGQLQGLQVDSFVARRGEVWCIFGANRSGIHTFFNLLSAETPDVVAEHFYCTADKAVLSFRRQQQIFEAELKKDDSDFLDRFDPGTPARAFLPAGEIDATLLETFGLSSSLEKGYRELSTGQTRKLLLLAECMRVPACLLLEAPYAGLDQRARMELDAALLHLQSQGCCVLMFVSNSVDIPPWATHLALVHAGELAWKGVYHKIGREIGQKSGRRFPAELFQRLQQQSPDFKPELTQAWSHAPGQKDGAPVEAKHEAPLIELRQGFASYRSRRVFSGLDLTLHRGEHLLITGANGSGKSTLLHLICGDHPACYQNELYLFGTRRGSGESIWDIKRNMGIVSAELQRNYHIGGDVLSCVVSGFFDSIGVYQKPDHAQIQQAHSWLAWIGLEHRSAHPFKSLSFADQRLVLIARALIKAPPLLLLDEPTQGLDEANRTAVLDFIEAVAAKKSSTIVYVSHRRDEQRPFFVQHLDMDKFTQAS